MVIVAGHVTVEPELRESYLAGCVRIVERAREADGCLDFAMTADLIDPGRVNIVERWESQAAVKDFRKRAPAPQVSRGNALGVCGRVRRRRRAEPVQQRHGMKPAAPI